MMRLADLSPATASSSCCLERGGAGALVCASDAGRAGRPVCAALADNALLLVAIALLEARHAPPGRRRRCASASMRPTCCWRRWPGAGPSLAQGPPDVGGESGQAGGRAGAGRRRRTPDRVRRHRLRRRRVCAGALRHAARTDGRARAGAGECRHGDRHGRGHPRRRRARRRAGGRLLAEPPARCWRRCTRCGAAATPCGDIRACGAAARPAFGAATRRAAGRPRRAPVRWR